jgi:hypothetical protein
MKRRQSTEISLPAPPADSTALMQTMRVMARTLPVSKRTCGRPANKLAMVLEIGNRLAHHRREQ